MQFYDLVMLAVMGGSILFGLWKGFAWQVASVAAIFVSYFVARNFNEPVANMIGGDPAWNRFLAMFILFMGSSLLVWIAFGFVRSSIERMHLKTFDRQAGALLGGVKGVILCTIATLFAVSLLGENTCRQVCTSKSGNYIARLLSHLGGVVPEEIGAYINPYIQKFQNEFEEHKNELPPENQQPGSGGLLTPGNQNQPNFQNPYGNPGDPNITQANNYPYERVGDLTPATDTSNQTTYPGQWQPPQSQTQPRNQAGGQFQIPQINLPPVDWQQVGERAVGEILNRASGSGN